MNIADRIASIGEKACSVLTLTETELGRRIIYVTRARIMIDAIRGVFDAMDQLERDGAPSDFDDHWRQLRSRLAHTQSRFEAVINAGDIQQIPCHSRQRDSKNWHL